MCASVLPKCGGGGAQKAWRDVQTHVLLADSVAGVARALPALCDAPGGRIAGHIVRAAARRARGIGVAAQDNVAAHAVRCVWLGAVDLGTRG